MRRSYALMLAMLCNLPASAQDSGLQVRPGAWQVNSGAPGQPMVAYQLCFRSGGLEDISLLLPRASGPGCPAPSLRREGSDLLWQLECPAARLAGAARYAVQAELVEANIEIRSGSPAAAHYSSLSARYVGPCATE